MTGRGAARLSPSPGLAAGQATQVVSHGRHHHNRLSVASELWSSGLNARAGSPQNRHSGPPSARASIHPVVLAVAAEAATRDLQAAIEVARHLAYL
jgi:hypothetical protein